MYFRIITELARSVALIDTWLDKAEAHAADSGQDVDRLIHGRLAPDMGDLIYQVQSACDYLKGGAAWLSGQRPPVHPDTETTIAEIRARIGRTMAFVGSVTAGGYADAADRRVRVSWAPAGTVIGGEDYLLQVAVPNVWFHASMAYAILRNAGVDVGKMDFLGTINFVPM